jgi:hypothetical protein
MDCGCASKKRDVKQTPLHYDERDVQRGMMLDVTFVSDSMKGCNGVKSP